MHSISCVALNGTQVNVIPLFGKIGVVTVLVVEVSVVEVLVVEVVVAVVVVDIVADVEVTVVDVIVTEVVVVVSVVDVLVEVVSRDGSRTQNISRSDHDSSKVHTRSLAAPHVVSHSATPPPPPPSPASSSSLLPSSVSHLHSCGDVVATVVVVAAVVTEVGVITVVAVVGDAVAAVLVGGAPRIFCKCVLQSLSMTLLSSQ